MRPNGSLYAYSPNSFVVDPAITFVRSRYTFSNTRVFPTDTDGLTGYFGSNFLLEPSLFRNLRRSCSLASAFVPLLASPAEAMKEQTACDCTMKMPEDRNNRG